MSKRKTFSSLLPLFLVLLISSGCNPTVQKEPENPVQRQFDSIFNVAELQLLNYVPADSVNANIDKLEVLTHCHGKHSDIRRARIHYLRGLKHNLMFASDSAMTEYKQALELTDSIDYPYDYLKYISAFYAYDPYAVGMEKYRCYQQSLSMARERDDSLFEAQTLKNLALLYAQIENAEKSLECFHQANDIFNKLGLKKLAVKNRINEAGILRMSGANEKSDSLLISLLDNAVIREDPYAGSLVAYNIYLSNHDIAYMRRAYGLVRDIGDLRGRRGFHCGVMSNYYYEQAEYDSALFYARRALADTSFITFDSQKATVMLAASNALHYNRNTDSAFIYRARYDLLQDSVNDSKRKLEVLRVNAMRELSIAEAEFRQGLFRRNVYITISAALLIAVAAWVMYNQKKKNLRQRLKRQEMEVTLKQARNKAAASAISLEEKDNMLESVRQQLSELREEGRIESGDGRRIELAIKSHLSENKNDEAFRDMFDTINPDFIRRLKEECPDLADSYVRLACYITMGLDNKKIAQLMMIKYQSVIQARWRLRKRLGLDSDDSLEHKLSELNSAHVQG